MKEWRSQLEQIAPAEELRFPATPGFRPFNRYFSTESISHPAKCNVLLLYYLIKKYTKEGETVLDPMSGTASTGIIASLLGRNAVCVELELKFVEWSKKSVELLERSGRKRGEITVLQGDARNLSQTLKRVDIAITSPPYSDSEKRDRSKESWWDEKRERKKAGGSVTIAKGYQGSPENIGNLSHGKIDCCITSPPYAEAQEGAGIAKRGYQSDKHSPTDLVGKRSYMPEKFESEENISRLPYGVDAVVTSPPHGNSYLGGGSAEKRRERLVRAGCNPKDFLGGKARNAVLEHFDSKENIGNLPFNCCITSPPYSEGIGHGGKRKTKVLTRNKGIWLQGRGSYSQNKENIGEMHHKTYLEAMLQVYREIWKVLKPNGKAIIIIKPFIRQKRVVDLPWHTFLLLRKVGFQLEKLYKLRLKQESFWRILYRKKYTEIPMIRHEYILICRKSAL